MLERLRQPVARPPRRAHARRGVVARRRGRRRDGRVRRDPRLADLRAQRPLAGSGSGGNLEAQLANMQDTSVHPPAVGLPPARLAARLRHAADDRPRGRARRSRSRCFSSIFIVELAPARLRRIAIPVIRLLASVPSVDLRADRDPRARAVRRQPPDHAAPRRPRCRTSSQLTGAGLARDRRDPHRDDHADHDRADLRGARRRSRTPGARARSRSGVNPLRAMLAVTLRAARPAIVAAAVLATARALGEAIMISMVSGSRAFAPKPIDGAHLPVRAAAHARLGDRRLPRRHRRAGARARRSTRSRCCCCSRPSCCRSAAT